MGTCTLAQTDGFVVATIHCGDTTVPFVVLNGGYCDSTGTKTSISSNSGSPHIGSQNDANVPAYGSITMPVPKGTSWWVLIDTLGGGNGASCVKIVSWWALGS
jgi:hypothetical protein